METMALLELGDGAHARSLARAEPSSVAAAPLHMPGGLRF